MYHDYILKEMSHGRIEDARRQAAEDSAFRQVRRQNSGGGESRSGRAVRRLVEGFYRAVSRRPAKAGG